VSESTKRKRKAAQPAVQAKSGKPAAGRARTKPANTGTRATAAKRPAKATAKVVKKTPGQVPARQTPKQGTAKKPAVANISKGKAAIKAKPTSPKRPSTKKATAAKTRAAGQVKAKQQPAAAAGSRAGVEPMAPPVTSDIVLPMPDAVLPETTQVVANDGFVPQSPTPPPGPADNDTEAQRKTGLLATNAVHATRRRLKRSWHQNRPLLAIGAAVLLGALILADQSEPPDILPLERVSAARTAPSVAASRFAARDEIDAIDDPVRATEVGLAATVQPPLAQAEPLAPDELLEMERMLARLDLEPSRVDGIIDLETRSAIRLYQQIAGLPIDGRPSSALLADMREVVRIMEGAE